MPDVLIAYARIVLSQVTVQNVEAKRISNGYINDGGYAWTRDEGGFSSGPNTQGMTDADGVDRGSRLSNRSSNSLDVSETIQTF